MIDDGVILTTIRYRATHGKGDVGKAFIKDDVVREIQMIMGFDSRLFAAGTWCCRRHASETSIRLFCFYKMAINIDWISHT